MKTNKQQAAEALTRLGVEGLYNPHGMVGKSCKCGTCFCCEAFKLVQVARGNPAGLQAYVATAH